MSFSPTNNSPWRFVLPLTATYVLSWSITNAIGWGVTSIGLHYAGLALKEQAEVDAKEAKEHAIETTQERAHRELMAAKERAAKEIEQKMEAEAHAARSKHLQPPRPLAADEQCVSGTIVKIDREKHSAVQVLENTQPIMCGQ